LAWPARSRDAATRLPDMPLYEYECAMCAERVEDFDQHLHDAPCANPTCEGRLFRVYSLFINPVHGAGGTPGKGVSQ
jgi:putative FmdB family regulatory protein